MYIYICIFLAQNLVPGQFQKTLSSFHSKNPDPNEFIEWQSFRASGVSKDDDDGEERDGSNSTLRGVRHFA